MTPRNPEESPEETTQDKALQAINETLNDNTDVPDEPAQQNTPVPEAPQEAVPDTKVELDRVKLYLRGPTVFSA